MYVSCIIVVKNKSIGNKVEEVIKDMPYMLATGIVVMAARDISPEVELVFKRFGEPAIMAIPATTIVSDAFRDTVLPYFYDIGKVIFWCSSAWGVFALMRKNIKDATAKIKWATVGYICLRCLEVFTKLVDRAALDMLNRMPK